MRVHSPDFIALLKTMVEHKVDFIIAGGISAVPHGAPVTTLDLDLLHSRSPDNINRLLLALKEIEACYRRIRLWSQSSGAHLKRKQRWIELSAFLAGQLSLVVADFKIFSLC